MRKVCHLKDFHGSWEPFTGLNAPLYNRSDEVGAQAILNVDWAVNYWLNNGVDREKLNLGLPTYGRTFKLTNPANNSLGAGSTGPGSTGSQTGEAGFLSYYEICGKLSQGWTRMWEPEQRAPYAYSGNEWVGYDDKQSLAEKVAYLKKMNLGGAMIWAIDLDDFSGLYCNQGKYPLINFIKNQLSSSAPLIVTSTFLPTDTLSNILKSISTTTIQNTSDTTDRNLCTKGDGFYADYFSSCAKYYRCLNSYNNPKVIWFSCPFGTIFDTNLKGCNWINSVTCKN